MKRKLEEVCLVGEQKQSRKTIQGLKDLLQPAQQTEDLRKKSLQQKRAITENCPLPDVEKLLDIFRAMDKKIKYSRHSAALNESKEIWKKRREVLTETVENIDSRDLLLLYYIRHIDGLYRSALLKTLKKVYRAQQELKNFLNDSDDLFLP